MKRITGPLRQIVKQGIVCTAVFAFFRGQFPAARNCSVSGIEADPRSLHSRGDMAAGLGRQGKGLLFCARPGCDSLSGSEPVSVTGNGRQAV